MSSLLDQGRTLFVDNWYTSYELARLMLTRNTDLVDAYSKHRFSRNKS